MAAKRKKVLAFLPGGGTNEIRVLSGVQDIARTRRFDLSVVECLKRKDGGLCFIRSPGRGGTVAEILDSVAPDGAIVAFNAIEPGMLRRTGHPSIPAVFIDRPAGEAVSGRSTPVCVFSNAASYARLAAAELFRSGFRDYAFLPWPEDPPWSRERCDAFAGVVAEEGKTFHPFRPPRGGAAVDLVAHVAPFLESLPKPCGIFAANDGNTTAFGFMAFGGGAGGNYNSNTDSPGKDGGSGGGAGGRPVANASTIGGSAAYEAYYNIGNAGGSTGGSEANLYGHAYAGGGGDGAGAPGQSISGASGAGGDGLAIEFTDTVAVDDLVYRCRAAGIAPDFAPFGGTDLGGIPRSWFDAYGIARDPAADPDGDGFTNRSEWSQGTDPSDPESCPPHRTFLVVH